MRFKRGDIVLSAPGWANGCYVITAVDPSRPKNIYTGIDLSTRKNYRLSDDGLGVKVGVAIDEFLNAGHGNSIADVNFERGKMRAQRMVRLVSNSDEKVRWNFLANTAHDQWIDIKLNWRQQRVQFKHVLEKGDKYVFLAVNLNGTAYRYPLASLVVPGHEVSKRHDAEIINDLRVVESGLSPENLTCDGELSKSEVDRRRRQLMGERSKLVGELGREPTDEELFPSLVGK